MVSNLDDNVGKLMLKLEKVGLRQNTMIWFLSINGGYSQTKKGHASNEYLRGEKASLYEGGIRVPAMVFWRYDSQSAIRSGKWKLVNGKELYDLSADIGESNNLPLKFPDMIKQLEQKFNTIEHKFEPLHGN